MVLFLPLILLGALMLGLVALVDLARSAGDLDPVGRLILAAGILFLPPVGLIAWMVVRRRRRIAVVTAGLTLGLAAAGLAAGHDPAVHMSSPATVSGSTHVTASVPR